MFVHAYTAATDAKLHAELVYLPGGADGGAPEQVLAAIDATPPPNAGFHLTDWIDTTACASSLAAQPGDGLELRLHYVSGSSAFTTIETTLTIP